VKITTLVTDVFVQEHTVRVAW